MQRLKPTELEHVVSLINDGLPLKQIARLTGRNKTTVYHHFRKIKGKTMKPVIFDVQDDERVGEFIGLFAGDGCADKTKPWVYRTRLCFGLKEKEFIKELIEVVLLPLFGKRPCVICQDTRLNVNYYSKDIYDFVEKYLEWDKLAKKTYSVRLRHTNHSREFMIGFLRGCLDSDGYVSQKKITFASVSTPLIDNIHKFLSKFKIRHSVYVSKSKKPNKRDMYFVYISKQEHCKFLNIIKPRNKKLNASAGNRTQIYCLEGNSSTTRPPTQLENNTINSL